VVHERSALVPLLREAASVLVTFGSGATEHDAGIRLSEGLDDLFRNGMRPRPLSSRLELACSAREMTRRQCEVFDTVVSAKRQAA